jgi:hypothetical protein
MIFFSSTKENKKNRKTKKGKVQVMRIHDGPPIKGSPYKLLAT